MDFIYFFTLNENEIVIEVRNLSGQKEFHIYNQLNLLIYSLEKIENDRKHLLNLASYCQKNFNIKNENYDDSFLDSYKNDELKCLIYQYIDNSYRTAINKFENSTILKVGYSSFLYLVLQKYNKSYMIFYDLLNNEKFNLTQSQEFYIFSVNKKFKNYIFHNGIDKTNISLKYQCNKLINLIAEISEFYSDFWHLLLNSQKYQDINILTQIGTKIYKLIFEIDYKYNKILQTRFKERQITLLYYAYKKDILNDFSFCYKYEDVIDLEDFFSKSININDINSLIASSTFQFIIISGKTDNFGTILNISQEVCSILGYTSEELIGQNMNILIPDFMRKDHDQVILNKFKNIKLMKNYETALKPHIFLMKTSSKFIFPIGLFVGSIYDDDNNPILFCKINLEQEQNLISNFSKFCQILTDRNLIIQFFTANCINLLGLKPKIINNNVDILTYIKEINDEFMKNYYPFIHSKKKIDKTQMKLSILKKYMPGEPEKIVVFNKEKCKIKIIQINVNKQFNGFLFNLTVTCKEEESIVKTAFNNNKTMSETNLKTFKTEKDTNIKFSKTKRNSILSPTHEFSDLTKNYLPESNELLFNYNEKAFYLNKKKGYNKKEKSSNDLAIVLKQKFLEKKLKIEKEEKSSSEESSDYSENSSESSNTSSNNEISSFSSTIEMEKLNNLNNEIEKDNNYYNVNLKKINYSVYNFQTNTFITLPKVVKGKIDELIQIENKISEKKLGEMNKPNVLSQEEKIQIGTELILPELERRSKIFYMKNKAYFEKKLFSKKLSNNILINIIIQFIHLLITFISGSLILIYCTDNKNLIQKLLQSIIYLIDLSDNSNILFSFSIFLVLTQNEKYTNFYYSRDYFKNECRSNLLNVYYESSELITELISRMDMLSKDYQKKIYDLNLTLYVIDDQLNLNIYITDIITIIRETNYAVYNLANTEDKDISFKNLDYNFIFYNTNDDFIDGINNLVEISIDEFINKYKSLIAKIYSFIAFIFIFLILCFLCSYKGITLIIKEKEKYLKFFFYIDVNYIRNNLSRCQKYINLNKKSGFDSKYFLSNPQVKLESESNEDENFSKLSLNENNLTSFKNSLKYNQLKKNKTITTNFISEKKNLCTYIFIYFIYIIILTLILIFLLMGNKYYYDKINHLIIIYDLLVLHRTFFLILYNYLRIIIVYSSFNMKNEYLNEKMILISEYFSSIFQIHQLYRNEINSNIATYGLYELSEKTYHNVTKNSLCPYYENVSKILNLPCEDLASNISNYGMSALMIYYIHSMQDILQNIAEKIEEASKSGFLFDELIYGTEEYNKILPNNTEDLKRYNELNPFNLINLEQLKHLNILNERVFKPSHTLLSESIAIDIYNILQKIERNQNGIILGFFLTIVLFNIFLYFPFLYKKNDEIKQVKQMLILIPQNILYEILIDEDKKKEKKDT